MIVWLASYPRSGNTFCRHVLQHVFGLATLSSDDLRSIRQEQRDPYVWQVSVTDLIGIKTASDLCLDDVECSAVPYFVKTHELAADGCQPAIYLVRDGRDSLLSYAHFALRYDQGRSTSAISPSEVHAMLERLLRVPRPAYGTWGQNVLSWLRRPRTAVVRFEQLVRRPVPTLQAALQQVGIAAEPRGEAPATFSELQAVASDFFRSGRLGQWREEFPRSLLPLFWQLNGEAMYRAGYGEADNDAAETCAA